MTQCFYVLMAFLIVVMHDTHVQSLQLLIFVHWGYLVYGYAHQPFKSKGRNRLNTLNQFVIQYTIQIMMYFCNKGIPDIVHTYLGYCLIAIISLDIIAHLA